MTTKALSFVGQGTTLIESTILGLRWQEICKHFGVANVVALKRNGAYAQYI